ncbi:hypothetical protein ACWCYL_43715 [Streptomyces sp. 900105755]
MDALTERLRLAADYLTRASSAAVVEMFLTAQSAVYSPTARVGELDRGGECTMLSPTGGDPRPARLSTIEDRQLRFRKEYKELLEAEEKGNIDSVALRRIAELTELFEGEQQAQVWWHRAALQGDPVAIMMLADD